MLELKLISQNIIEPENQSTTDILKRGFFGSLGKKKITLNIFEALYLIDVRNAVIKAKRTNNTITFEELLFKYNKKPKFMAKYLTYKDWRDRGLVAKDLNFIFNKSEKEHPKQYPSNSITLPAENVTGIFFPSDLTAIIDNEAKGKLLYENNWFGQYGSYKASERGKLNKLDVYETLFLIEKNILTLINYSKKDVLKAATKRRKDFLRLFEVYKDWRDRGYVIKTGFKFGTHFRVYFPGAKPINNKNNDWIHSKHVIQVFPKDSHLLISEWARAIRVAHSVRKTFILAVPGSVSAKKTKPDFILYHRRGAEAENPELNHPKYAMLSLSEEEYIGGREFAGALQAARDKKLELILAIADRETAVTYYKVREIKLKKNEIEYYEIDWMQP